MYAVRAASRGRWGQGRPLRGPWLHPMLPVWVARVVARCWMPFPGSCRGKTLFSLIFRASEPRMPWRQPDPARRGVPARSGFRACCTNVRRRMPLPLRARIPAPRRTRRALRRPCRTSGCRRRPEQRPGCLRRGSPAGVPRLPGAHVPSVNRHGEYGDGFARQRGGVPGGMGQVDGRDCRFPVHAFRFAPVPGGRFRCRRGGSRFRGLPGRGFRCRVVSGGRPCGSPFRPCHPLRHGCGDFPRCPGRREKEGVNACRFHVPGRFFSV